MSKTEYLLKMYEDKCNCVSVTTQFNQQVDRKYEYTAYSSHVPISQGIFPFYKHVEESRKQLSN
jgi:hypothetical protein